MTNMTAILLIKIIPILENKFLENCVLMNVKLTGMGKNFLVSGSTIKHRMFFLILVNEHCLHWFAIYSLNAIVQTFKPEHDDFPA